MPSLYVVATPIGNLEDITLRALRILREVGLIAAEDTRKTRRLLSHYDIKTPMTSFYEHSKLTKLDYILNFLENKDVAIVSEAGMPGISDPGYELIVAAIERGISVVPIPGPSVIITALMVSGLATEQFNYLGFLPRQANSRLRLLKAVVDKSGTLVFFEAPHRLLESLKDLLATLGDRRIAVCRELTKLHEEVLRGRISEAIEHFTEPRGEFTLVVEGNKTTAKPQLTNDIERQLRKMRLSGVPAKEAIVRVGKETGLSRKELYQAWLKLA